MAIEISAAVEGSGGNAVTITIPPASDKPFLVVYAYERHSFTCHSTLDGGGTDVIPFIGNYYSYGQAYTTQIMAGEIYAKVSPSSGAQTFTLSGCSKAWGGIGAVVFTGVSQTTPIRNLHVHHSGWSDCWDTNPVEVYDGDMMYYFMASEFGWYSGDRIQTFDDTDAVAQTLYYTDNVDNRIDRTQYQVTVGPMQDDPAYVLHTKWDDSGVHIGVGLTLVPEGGSVYNPFIWGVPRGSQTTANNNHIQERTTRFHDTDSKMYEYAMLVYQDYDFEASRDAPTEIGIGTTDYLYTQLFNDTASQPGAPGVSLWMYQNPPDIQGVWDITIAAYPAAGYHGGCPYMVSYVKADTDDGFLWYSTGSASTTSSSITITISSTVPTTDSTMVSISCFSSWGWNTTYSDTSMEYWRNTVVRDDADGRRDHSYIIWKTADYQRDMSTDVITQIITGNNAHVMTLMIFKLFVSELSQKLAGTLSLGVGGLANYFRIQQAEGAGTLALTGEISNFRLYLLRVSGGTLALAGTAYTQFRSFLEFVGTLGLNSTTNVVYRAVLAFAGTLVLSGTTVLKTIWKRVFTGLLSLSGEISDMKLSLTRFLAGTLALAGSYADTFRSYLEFAGTLALSGATQMNTLWKRAITGVLDFSGAIADMKLSLSRFLAGTLTFSSAMFPRLKKFVIAFVSLSLKPITIVRAWLAPSADVDLD